MRIEPVLELNQAYLSAATYAIGYLATSYLGANTCINHPQAYFPEQ